MGSTRVGFFVHGLTWGLLLALLTLAAPKAEAMFADFSVPLPRITSRVFEASHLAVAYPWIILIPIVADWFALDAYSSRDYSRWSLAWSVCWLAIPLALIALTITALILPLMTIDIGLSG
jgi:type II secretory pathway component PulF